MKYLKDKKIILLKGQIKFKTTFYQRLVFLFANKLDMEENNQPTLFIHRGLIFTKRVKKCRK